MQFVQKTVFSSNGISQDLVNLLGSYGETQVKKAFESAKNKDMLIGLMKEVLDYKFIDLPEGNYNSENKIPFQSMERVLRQLKYFTVDSPYYKDLETKKRKLLILLESVTFVEAEALCKLIRGEYDKASIRSYLNPPRKKKEQPIQSTEKAEPLSQTSIANN
jgi:hypothetical protein